MGLVLAFLSSSEAALSIFTAWIFAASSSRIGLIFAFSSSVRLSFVVRSANSASAWAEAAPEVLAFFWAKLLGAIARIANSAITTYCFFILKSPNNHFLGMRCRTDQNIMGLREQVN